MGEIASNVVTRKEVLNLLGIRKTSLRRLEVDASLPEIKERQGYNAIELKRLLKAFEKALKR